MILQKGQKMKLQDLTAGHQICVRICAQMGQGQADITCFGVDAANKLSDDRYFVFYNQPASPAQEITMQQKPGEVCFSIDLDKLPQSIQRLVFTVAADGDAEMRNLAAGSLALMETQGGAPLAEYAFAGSSFDRERALILCELYRKDNIWRMTVVASGFNGGLSALLAHFGGQEVKNEIAPAPVQEATPVPAPAATPVSAPAKRIDLKKSGDTHKIDLKKNSGEIHVNLNWKTAKKLFGGAKVDLDLACMYRLKSGQMGVIQALGNQFGAANREPYILLDQDDRTGMSENGENMYFKRPDLVEFAIVFAYIYDGVANWRQTDASVVLHQTGSPDIAIQIDNANSKERFCVLASLSGSDGHLEVKREERFFSGHREVDRYYGFGFRWVAGHK